MVNNENLLRFHVWVPVNNIMEKINSNRRYIQIIVYFVVKFNQNNDYKNNQLSRRNFGLICIDLSVCYVHTYIYLFNCII